MKIFSRIMMAAAMLGCSAAASAQYYELANQITNVLSPALSGSMNYKGYVDVSGVAGVGHNRANFIGISTTQGFQYSSWFFMGAGIGIDVAMAQDTDYSGRPDYDTPWWADRAADKTKAMLPIFSDFRFNIGSGNQDPSFFIDLKLGAAWLLGDNYLELRDVRMGNGAQFYFKPSLGVRVPLSSKNPKQAVNFGVTYQLLTSDNNYSWYGNSVTLSSFGATIGFEW